VPPTNENADMTSGKTMAMPADPAYRDIVKMKCSHGLVFLLSPMKDIIYSLQGAIITAILTSIRIKVPHLPTNMG
jgi:hypothetical protein